MLGIQTRGGRMKVAEESTELQQHAPVVSSNGAILQQTNGKHYPSSFWSNDLNS